jgi:hypothetical protein
MNRIRISGIGCRALDGGKRTHGDDSSAGLGCDLAGRVLCSPAIDEYADNGEDAEGRRDGHVVLTWAFFRGLTFAP